MHKRLTLTKRGIETPKTERDTALDASKCEVALDRGEFKRQRLDLTAIALPTLQASNPSTSILMKVGMPWRAIKASSVVTGTQIVRVQRCASHPGASRAALMNSRDAVETVGLSGLTIRLMDPASAADRYRFNDDVRVAAVKQA